ncbi:hypothetical protein [Vandammella animalimorsus]|uniref:hypothetical protein n=1 Tax=Vandammella animalimorsus TaxID=2029117 RepID=UPI0011777B1A|nr:hypothetical protein [Vandammella animalimorsus]
MPGRQAQTAIRIEARSGHYIKADKARAVAAAAAIGSVGLLHGKWAQPQPRWLKLRVPRPATVTTQRARADRQCLPSNTSANNAAC